MLTNIGLTLAPLNKFEYLLGVVYVWEWILYYVVVLVFMIKTTSKDSKNIYKKIYNNKYIEKAKYKKR